MVLRGRDAIALARSGWVPYLRQAEATERVDKWMRGKQQDIEIDPDGAEDGSVFMPDRGRATREYKDLANRAPNPWAPLVVDTLVQTMFVSGVYARGSSTLLGAWGAWQENGMDARQIPLYRSTIGHGLAYASCLPAVSRFGAKRTAQIRGHSAKSMAAFFTDDDDEYPLFALQVRRVEPDIEKLQEIPVFQVTLWDEVARYYLEVRGTGYDDGDWTFISYDEHGLGFTPIIQYSNQIDLDGETKGEIAPIVPLLRRIDQDVFDRLIVQRFGAWKVRYATGLAKPDSAETAIAERMRLKVEDLLINSSPDGRFGTLDASDIEGFIKATEADLRTLSAVTQTPPHHMLGLSSNMQAESLAAVEAGLQRKSFERKTNIGERHEQLLRTAAFIRGDVAEASAFDMQIRWRDMESRSLSQAADAMGKLAQQVGVPVQMLWEKYLPDWTDSDSERALDLIGSGAVDQLLAQFDRQGAQNGQTELDLGLGGA